MSGDVEFAVTRLTEPHTVKVGEQTGECEALLVMLKAGIYPSLGRTEAGGGGGNPFDIKAFTLYELVDGVVRSWLDHFGQESRGDLCNAVWRLFGTIETERAGGRVDDDLYERLMAMFTQWVWEIEDLFDPPREKEILAPCPSCGERYEMTQSKTETTRRAAVRIPLKAGRALIAECHCCGALWVTEEQLRVLALAVGAISIE